MTIATRTRRLGDLLLQSAVRAAHEGRGRSKIGSTFIPSGRFLSAEICSPTASTIPMTLPPGTRMTLRYTADSPLTLHALCGGRGAVFDTWRRLLDTNGPPVHELHERIADLGAIFAGTALV